MQESTRTDCVVINTRGYWTLNCFPPRNVCPSMRTEWNPPPPLLILSGYHSDRTLGWEFGFEFSRRRKKPKGQKHREGGAGHGETFVLVILKNYTWGWRGNKKNVFWLEWMKGSRNGWEWIAETEREKKTCFYLNWDNDREWQMWVCLGLNVQFCVALYPQDFKNTKHVTEIISA